MTLKIKNPNYSEEKLEETTAAVIGQEVKYRLEITFDERVATKISLSNHLEHLTEKIEVLKNRPPKSKLSQDELVSMYQRHEKNKTIVEDLLKKLDSAKQIYEDER